MRKALIIAILVLATLPVFAQRTAQGQFLASAGVSYNYAFAGSAELRFGQYLSIGYWDAGLVAENYRYRSSGSGNTFSVLHAVAEGEFMFRLASTRTRFFNLYAGSGLFLGAEMTDPYKRLRDGEWPVGSDGKYLPKASFIFGVSPRVEMEFFAFPHTAITVYGRMPLSILSKYGVFHVETGLGVKYNF